jgi:hypothetical protein
MPEPETVWKWRFKSAGADDSDFYFHIICFSHSLLSSCVSISISAFRIFCFFTFNILHSLKGKSTVLKDCRETFSWLVVDGCSWCHIALFANERKVDVRLRYLFVRLLQPRFGCWFRICYQFWRWEKHDGDKCQNIAENGTFSVFRIFCTEKFVPNKNVPTQFDRADSWQSNGINRVMREFRFQKLWSEHSELKNPDPEALASTEADRSSPIRFFSDLLFYSENGNSIRTMSDWLIVSKLR